MPSFLGRVYTKSRGRKKAPGTWGRQNRNMTKKGQDELFMIRKKKKKKIPNRSLTKLC